MAITPYSSLIDYAAFAGVGESFPYTALDIIKSAGGFIREFNHHRTGLIARHYANGVLLFTKCGTCLVGDFSLLSHLEHYFIVPIADHKTGLAFTGEDYSGCRWYWSIGGLPTKDLTSRSSVQHLLLLSDIRKAHLSLSKEDNNRVKIPNATTKLIVIKNTTIADDYLKLKLEPKDVILVWTSRRRTFVNIPEFKTTIEVDATTLKRLYKNSREPSDIKVAAVVLPNKTVAMRVVATEGKARRFGEMKAPVGSLFVPVIVMDFTESVFNEFGLEVGEAIADTPLRVFEELKGEATSSRTLKVKVKARRITERQLHVMINTKDIEPTYKSNRKQMSLQFFNAMDYEGIQVAKGVYPAQLIFVDATITNLEVKSMLKGISYRFEEYYPGASLSIEARSVKGKTQAKLEVVVDQTKEENERAERLRIMRITGHNQVYKDPHGTQFIAQGVDYLRGAVWGITVRDNSNISVNEIYDLKGVSLL